MSSAPLKDQFSRTHDYLRISLIERCNLRCQYCMPEEGIPLRDKAEFMTHEEVVTIARQFTDLGVSKIRLTGGEPLIKKGFDLILSELSKLPVKLHITTNGILLDRYWNELKAASMDTLNISLDSLDKEKFSQITRRNYFNRVWDNIHTAIDKNFRVKLNVVLMKHFNEDEIVDFVKLTQNNKIDVRFIEFMPFDGNNWDWSKKVSYEEILTHLRIKFGEDSIKPLKMEPNGTSRNFRIDGFVGSFGIISSITNPFCDGCNRIRLTADGKIKNCLFSNSETDLLTPFRNGEDIEPLIRQSIRTKKKERGGLTHFSDESFEIKNRSMTSIGG